LRHVERGEKSKSPIDDWLKWWLSGLLLYAREIHHGSTTKSRVRSISPGQRSQMQVAHMVIAVEEERIEAYVRAVMKVGVVLSNEAYHTDSPRGEHKAKGTRRTQRQLET
jgi:hypothetical protein